MEDMRLIRAGIDIIALARLSRVLKRNPRFFLPLCSAQEKPELCSDQYEGLWRAACLWTVKEATAKCLGTGFWRQNVEWPDVIVQDMNFAPLHHLAQQDLDFATLDTALDTALDTVLDTVSDTTRTKTIQVSIQLSGTAQKLFPHAVFKGHFELFTSSSLKSQAHALATNMSSRIDELSTTQLYALARVEMYQY